MSGPRHFLDLADFDTAALRGIIEDAKARKARRGGRPRGTPDDERALAGRTAALIFEKQSTRTRISFDMAMRQLGGQTMVLNGYDLQLGHGETVADTARTLSRYVDGIVLRTDAHAKLMELAGAASIPVINGLTDRAHPCQTVSDIMTFEEHLGPIQGKTIGWSGSHSNVAASWIHAAARLGFTFRMATPEGFDPPSELVAWAKRNGAKLEHTRDPLEAVAGADCVITDVWVSITEEDSIGHGAAELRHNRLAPYRVDERVMAAAAPHAIFMHCLPARRGEEVAASVIDGPRSVVFDGAENRLHAQKSILLWCLG